MRIWEAAAVQEARLRAEGRWEKYAAVLGEYVALGIKRGQAKQALQYPFGAGSQREPMSAAEFAAKHPEHVRVKKVVAGGMVGAETTTGGDKILSSNFTTPASHKTLRVKARIFRGKSCDERTAVQWVFDHLSISDVRPDEAPSAGAWTMLMKCREDRKFEETFLQSIWPKLLPSKSQLETVAKYEDAGTPALDLIRTLRAKTQGIVELVQ